MPSQKQIEANRRNAKHSTGPRTEAGKQRASQNAIKHGLQAKQSVIPGEDPAEFEQHLMEFHDTFNPGSAYERALVRQMADAEWRMRRISRLESAFLSSAFDERRRHYEELDDADAPERNETSILGDIMQDRTADINHFARYEIQPKPPLSSRLSPTHRDPRTPSSRQTSPLRTGSPRRP